MLAPPTVGMHRSVQIHNVSFAALCDWIEGSVLFQDEEELFASDVINVLIENGIYESQEFAWDSITSAWDEIRRRLGWIGQATPLEVTRLSLRRLRDWQDAPAHSFCMALSYSNWYPKWASQFGQDYNEQGELFERLTKEAMEKFFPDWVIHRTGWSRTQAIRLNEVVKDVVDRLGEAIGNVRRWTNNKANEAGLDLLCYKPFNDGRVGVPVFLMQCGSGGNWDGKLHTPNLRVWTKIVQWASKPKKAFATPYALSDEDFIEDCNLVNGLFLDRYRLLSCDQGNPDWVSADLKADIVAWLEPRIQLLPQADE